MQEEETVQLALTDLQKSDCRLQNNNGHVIFSLFTCFPKYQ